MIEIEIKKRQFLSLLDRSYEEDDFHRRGHPEPAYCLQCSVPQTNGRRVRRGSRAKFEPVQTLMYHLAFCGIEPRDFAVALATWYATRYPNSNHEDHDVKDMETGSTQWLVEILSNVCLQRPQLVQVLELL
jgi:hypothetical protein